ncbi:UDP-N-acetylmuramate dehydrogenase [Tenggerimyces flavus]|uniref:UDP-N-acetylenolpyruvoylglucosamine reductase n=1 Tax=Tenggerimyces flavus TaxID=1708749 RepID=A0ABV7YLJ2_9ACTN|nr:UDP-N-acetylmuramate dehydrogenase [Tenggerimyces flavus]MBM7785800.1 UDP-N-acetylmuramate dehydrogenase [Tenggerimyces flavus]
MYDVPLSTLTTLRLGGPAKELLEISDTDELCSTVERLDAAGEAVLILGGGSNLVVGDAGFPGTVVRVATRGIAVEDDSSCAGVTVRVAAGENWDAFVRHAIEQSWVGVEALSGIPGLVGAAPIQNVGAYGQEVENTLAQVRVWDRVDGQVRTFANADCGFGYRTSRFKREPERYVVLEVVFQFRVGDLGAPVRYAELARTLGTELDRRVPLVSMREAVLGLRRGKGMVLDPDDHDTWSAGSFFTNPILDAAHAANLPGDAPQWPAGEGLVKTSAAWLIEQAGYVKGYGSGSVRLSSKHTLALTNRGGASTEELLTLAREVRDGVHSAFGIDLVPEPVLVSADL